MRNILLVEDDPFIVEIYQKKFTSAGFKMDNAATGKEALRYVAQKEYDLILLDLVLPEMTGLEFLHEYRGKPTEYPYQTQVIIFSNLNSSSDREQALQAGANGFISKTDFTPTEVITEVNRFLHQFDQRAKNEAKQVGSSTVSGDTAATKASPIANGKKILLIEDEEIFAEMFGSRLMSEGFTVVTEVNGDKGLQLALTGNFDLIITDAILPGLDGREIVNRLRANDVTHQIPIFFLSASLDHHELSELQQSGSVDETILKTKITPSELVEKVNHYLSHSE